MSAFCEWQGAYLGLLGVSAAAIASFRAGRFPRSGDLGRSQATARVDNQIPMVLDTVGMRTKLSREEQVERNRRLVLEAARRVFLARGYASATLDVIADEAGFSKGVVYSQFASKADMFLALLEASISERAEQNERLAGGLARGERGVRGRGPAPAAGRGA